MRVWIRDVEQATGREWFTIFWSHSPYAFTSHGRCYTGKALEASLCREAKRLGRPIDLETDGGHWERITSVSLLAPEVE